MGKNISFTLEDAKRIGKVLKIDFDNTNLDEFIMGLNVELEHGKINPETNITEDDEILTAKIALAHLGEYSDYYTRLEELEAKAKKFWINN